MKKSELDQVNNWIERYAMQLSSDQLVHQFNQTVAALWRIASRTIGNFVIVAILERVVLESIEGYPIFALLKVDERGVHFDELQNRANSLNKSELIEGFRVFLAELLTLLSTVTAGLITPSLHELLSKGALEIQTQSFIRLARERGIDQQTYSDRFPTGVRNFDEILQGGLPKGSLVLIGGNPGTGKTILSQQICFFNASMDTQVIFFQTLSEPLTKTLSFLQKFKFYDSKKVGRSIHFVDLSDIIRTKGLENGAQLLIEHIQRIRPSIIVIDSFKAFDDLSTSRDEFRKFCYEVAIKLIVWECTCLLLGEFLSKELESSPLTSVIDGIISLSQRQESGEQKRFLQVIKLRGTAHSRDEHSLLITEEGLELYTPRVTIRRIPQADIEEAATSPLRTGIKTLDQLIEEGIPRGSSILVAGVSGTGKTLLSLECMYRGAKEFNEKGIAFLFEETRERILALARRIGWDFETEIQRGYLEIVAIPQQDILIERHLLMMHEKIISLGAKRVVIDSISVFTSKISSPEGVREKIYQLATIVQNAHAVGFFVTDIPYGTNRLSRYGIEETVVDGIILLNSTLVQLRRIRYLEIYKIRNASHQDGRYRMTISKNGIVLLPAHEDEPRGADAAA